MGQPQISQIDANPNPLIKHLPRLLIVFAVLAACWGLYVVYALYTGTSLSGQMAHVPFWVLFGTMVATLNYLPLAKSKPKLLPWLGIILTIGTTVWFCVNNFFNISNTEEFVGRLQLDMSLIVSCYCLTHMSLMLLTYRPEASNFLLKLACVAVAISGISYIAIFSGMAGSEFFVILVLTAVAFFFIKFALTVALIVTHLANRGHRAKFEQALPG